MIGGRGLALLAAVAAVGCTGSGNDRPDGRILLLDGLGVMAISVDDGRARPLRLEPEPWGGVAYSPDEERIAYDAEDGIYVADADGSNARRIPDQPSVQDFLSADPSWSPDGDHIVFGRDQSLYTISPDGGDLKFLDRGSTPRWAPDGRIVFTSGYDQNRVYADIVVMGADGGGRKVLARGDHVDVSPDGRTIAYSGPGGTDPAANKRAVYVMRLNGGERRRVTDNGYAPIWSPDGDYLAFTRITQCGPCRLQRPHLRHASRRRRGTSGESANWRPGWCDRLDQVEGTERNRSDPRWLRKSFAPGTDALDLGLALLAGLHGFFLRRPAHGLRCDHPLVPLAVDAERAATSTGTHLSTRSSQVLPWGVATASDTPR